VSLILDALRRADSERERGEVPGLHAHPVPAFSAEAPTQTRARPWLWIAIVAGAAVLAALAWVIAGRDAPRQAAAPAIAQSPVAPVPALPSVPPAATAPAPIVAAAPAPTSAAAPPPRAGAPEAQPVAEPAPWPAPDSSRKAAAPDIAAAPATGKHETKAMQPVSATPPEAPITPRAQLPENIRSQLPPLAVGGSIYSASAPDRSVIIDGRLYRENDRLTTDLTLEQIRPRAAVLRYKGYRFEVGF